MWNVTKYIYSGTVLKNISELHYIYLTAVYVDLDLKNNDVLQYSVLVYSILSVNFGSTLTCYNIKILITYISNNDSGYTIPPLHIMLW